MKYDTNIPFQANQAKTYFYKLLGGKEKIEVKVIAKNRTISQNAYFHASVSLFAIELGYSLDEAKTLLKRKCQFMRYEKNGEWFLKKTSKLNTKEMSDFMEWFRTYSAKEGIYIMTPEEYKENSFEVDQIIARNKEHL